MRFEQAFYSRDPYKGLGIVATSNELLDFVKNCDMVGANFETEPTQETAEFVFYSKAFQRYVGVGVSPAGYADRAGVNKLVHILVPTEESTEPSDYYLPYPFERVVDTSRPYQSVEISSVLSLEDSNRILSQYEMTPDFLALLLYKASQVVFGEQNLMEIVLPPLTFAKEKHPVIAREISWLLSQLIPAPIGETRNCRTRLAYSVLSSENIGKVNLAFVVEKTGFENSIVWNEQPQEAIPEVYFALAQKAFESIEVYRAFVEELYQSRLDRELSTRILGLMYLQWQLVKEHSKLRRDALPMSLHWLITMAQKSIEYRTFLYRVVAALEDCTERDIADLSVLIFRPVLAEQPMESRGQDFRNAFKNILRIAFRVNYKFYGVYLRDLQGETLQNVLYDLWHFGVESDFIICQDLQSITTATECVEKLRLYEGLREEEHFASIMKGIVRSYYFDMSLEDREYVSEVLGEPKGISRGENIDYGSFRGMVEERIRHFFGQGDWLLFFEKEIGKIERSFRPFYFKQFLGYCESKEYDEVCQNLQEKGDLFLKYYLRDVEPHDLEKYQDIVKLWNGEAVWRTLSGMSLAELAGYRDFVSYAERYRKYLFKIWYRLVEEILPREALDDELMRSFMERKGEVCTYLGSDSMNHYIAMFWQKYENCLREEIMTLSFSGLAEFDFNRLDYPLLAGNTVAEEKKQSIFDTWFGLVEGCIKNCVKEVEQGQSIRDLLDSQDLVHLIEQDSYVKIYQSKRLYMYEDHVWRLCLACDDWAEKVELLSYATILFDCGRNVWIELYQEWEQKGFGNLEYFEALNKSFSSMPFGEDILNHRNVNGNADFVCKCFRFWLKITQKEEGVPDDFIYTKGMDHGYRDFLEALETTALLLGDEISVRNYLQIERFLSKSKENGLPSRSDNVASDITRKYQIVATDYPEFSREMMEMTIESLPDKQMQRILGQMQMVVRLTGCETLTTENAMEGMELWIAAKDMLGSCNVLVLQMEKECRRYMSELDKEIYELEQEIKRKEEELARKRLEKRELDDIRFGKRKRSREEEPVSMEEPASLAKEDGMRRMNPEARDWEDPQLMEPTAKVAEGSQTTKQTPKVADSEGPQLIELTPKDMGKAQPTESSKHGQESQNSELPQYLEQPHANQGDSYHPDEKPIGILSSMSKKTKKLFGAKTQGKAEDF